MNRYYDVLVRIDKKDWYVESLIDDLLCSMYNHIFEVSKPESSDNYEFRGFMNDKWFRRLTTLQAMSPLGAGYKIYIKKFSFETYKDEWTLYC